MSDYRRGAHRLLKRRACGRAALAAAVLYGLAGATIGAAQIVENKYNDDLAKLQPADQAAKLAAYMGFFCVGTKPFFMGITKDGPAKGFAYWSLECAGARSYAIQIAPDGKAEAIDCNELKASANGRECYKTF
jgi:hypothetical protein